MREEWNMIVHSTWMKIVLVAIILIPMLYAGVFLGSMWDPYGKTSELPVAVINHDNAIQYQGVTMNIGANFVENLKENKAMDFQFVNEKVAEQGLEDGSYYMIITIPQDFSANAATVLDNHPKKMELQYTTNPGTNYIATKMDDSAMNNIRERVSETVTQTYVTTLFTQINNMHQGLQDATSGSRALMDGSSKASVGSETLYQSLAKLSSSTLIFSDGTKTFEEGFNNYLQGTQTVKEGSHVLYDGMESMKQRVPDVLAGVDQLVYGTTTFRSGLQSYTAAVQILQEKGNRLIQKNVNLTGGIEKLSNNLLQLQNGNLQVCDGLQQMSDTLRKTLETQQPAILELTQKNSSATKQLITVNEQICSIQRQIELLVENQSEKIELLTSIRPNVNITQQQMIDQWIVDLKGMEHIELLRSLDQLTQQSSHLQTLLMHNQQMVDGLSNGLEMMEYQFDKTDGFIQGMNSMQRGLSQVNASLQENQGLVQGIKAYTQGTTMMVQGIDQLDRNSKNLTQGFQQLQTGITLFQSDIPVLADGINQGNQGCHDLFHGLQAITTNNDVLSNAFLQISKGAIQFNDASYQLYQGSYDLVIGIKELSIGNDTLTNALQDGYEKSNLQLSDENKTMFVQPVELSKTEVSSVENNGHAMAPYMMSVGLYVACMAFTLMYPLLKNGAKITSGIRLWMSKASVMYSVSTLMAVVMIAVLMLVNGMQPLFAWKTFLIGIIIAAAFMSMIVFFSITCGKIGSFLVLVFMVLQLGGAAGTYPIETSSTFFNTIHPFVPFTYSVNAFRNTLATGGSISYDVTIFIIIFVIFSSLTIVFYYWRGTKNDEQFDKTYIAKLQ